MINDHIMELDGTGHWSSFLPSSQRTTPHPGQSHGRACRQPKITQRSGAFATTSSYAREKNSKIIVSSTLYVLLG
jgi:hypothetical protein